MTPMQPLRLFVVALAVVALLSIVAGFATRDAAVQDGDRGTATAVTPRATSDRTVEAKVPRKEPIVARVGETVELTVTLEDNDTLRLDAFGVEEDIAEGVPTPVLIDAIAPGRYDLKLEDSGRTIGRLVVRAAEDPPASGGATPEAQPRQPVPSMTDPATV